MSSNKMFQPALWLLICSCLSPVPASAAGRHDFVLFPELKLTEAIDGNDKDNDITPALNVIYTYNNGSFRLLGEYTISDEENELERLQLGWLMDDQNALWFGRVHNPDNYWNTTFHHGQYLQTSISRPWISRFEDEGGPLLSHTTGLLVDTGIQRKNDSGIKFALSAGAGAHFEGDLEPFDLLSPESGHDFTTHGRLSFLPDYLSRNQFGFTASYSNISVSDTLMDTDTDALRRIKQSTLGAYVDWIWGKTRAIAEARFVHNRMKTQRTRNDRFWGSYLHIEHAFSDTFTLYGRIDYMGDETDSLYLALLDDVISNQYVIGLRIDFSRRQAFTMEIMDKVGVDETDDRTNIQIQWSAAFP